MIFSAPTLDEAYTNASKTLNCSVVELEIDVIQHPSRGLFGLFAKQAIIKITNASELKKSLENDNNKNKKEDEKLKQNILQNQNKDSDQLKEEITSVSKVHISDTKVQKEVFEGVKKILDVSCYDLDVKEVKVANNNVYIKIDGKDAALMIGVEGYRYKALSYILHNWIKLKYNMTISLEIAEFLKNQEENIKNYIEGIKERVKEQGRVQTKPLDGILVKIALEELRRLYPNMYVAIKTLRDGKKVVVVNQQQNRSER